MHDREELIRRASEYAAAGYTIIKLNGKVPATSDWPNADYVWPDQVAEFLKGWNGNYGVVLGRQDLVIDVDPRNFKQGDKPHARLFADIGCEAKTFAAIARTGGGGVHLYCRLPSGVQVKENLAAYPGVEFKSRGRQVVGVGSLHPETKKVYAWAGGQLLGALPEAPPELVERISRSSAAGGVPGDLPRVRGETQDVRELDQVAAIARYAEWLAEAPVAIQGANGDKTTFTVACKGRDMGLSREKTLELMLVHYNHRCIPDWRPDELAIKVRNAYEYASEAAGSATPEAQFPPVVAATDEKHPLFRGWDKKASGALEKTLNNVFNYFLIRESPLRGVVAYDEFNAQVRIVKKLPWHGASPLPPGGLEWKDDDSVQFRLWLSRERQFDVKLPDVDQAVLTAAQMHILHPVKDYLRSLRWDGRSRIDSWLVDFAGARDDKYVREASKKFLLQAVSRVYHPGCKADHIIVLEGDQGVGKSSLVEILGGPWYGDIVIDPHSRDTVDAMRGKWFLEFSEMEVVNRSEAQALKAFITRKVDRVRLAYGRRSVDLPRQCVFMGTMNPDATGQYLTDPTGNRRVWPVLISQVKFAALQAARDQLFAEAVDLVLKGEATYMIDREVAELAVVEQKARLTSDPWTGIIDEWAADQTNPYGFITSKDVWIYALKGSEAALNVVHQRRIASCLREIGYVPHVRREKNRIVRGFLYGKLVPKTDLEDLI